MTSVSAKFKSDHHIQARREYEFVSIYFNMIKLIIQKEA